MQCSFCIFLHPLLFVIKIQKSLPGLRAFFPWFSRPVLDFKLNSLAVSLLTFFVILLVEKGQSKKDMAVSEALELELKAPIDGQSSRPEDSYA